MKNRLNILILIFFIFPVWLLFCQSGNYNWIEKNESENYVARHEFGFVQAGNKFILFGGRESPTRLDVYDYATNTWTIGGTAPEQFNHFQAVYYEGLVWVIGAFKDNSFPNEESTDFVYMYNPATEQWIQGPEIPETRKRGAGGLVVRNDKFYLIGGNNNGHDGGYVPYFDEYDPFTGDWNILPDAPNARDHFHTVIYNNKLYAIAGRLTGGPGGTFAPMVNEVDVFDFNLNAWTTLGLSSNIPTPRAGVGCVVFENEIFVIGGESDTGLFDTVEAFNPNNNTWLTKDNLNNPRHGIQAIVSNNTIYVIGGAGNSSSLKDMEYYGPSDNPAGNATVNSTFAADEDTKLFTYAESDGQATVEIILSNSTGNTGTYIDSITISGTNYSLDSSYENILLGANQDLVIQAILNDTSALESLGNIQVTYNNNFTLNIALEGTQDNTASVDEEDYGNLLVLPTVTNDLFTLNKNSNSITIFDISGKLIKSFNGNFGINSEFNISDMANGLYFIDIRHNSGAKKVLKIIKN